MPMTETVVLPPKEGQPAANGKRKNESDGADHETDQPAYKAHTDGADTPPGAGFHG